MAAITDLSDLINRMTGGNNGTPESLFFHKVARIGGSAATAPVAGRTASLWRYDGMPAGGSVPTSGAIPDRTTTGAMPFTAPGGGREKWLIGGAINSLVQGTYLLYDRLYHIGGLSGTTTTAQTVQGSPASPALTRNTGGAGNQVYYEIYTAVGGTATTISMNYTDDAGNSSITSPTMTFGGTGFNSATRMQRIPLASGDTGVRAVNTVTVTATTGTAGNFGITIIQPLALLTVGQVAVTGWRDYTTGLPGIPDIHTDACLSLMFTPSAATAPELFGALDFVEK